MASARALIIARIFSGSSQSRGGRGGRSEQGGGGGALTGSAMLDLARFKTLFGTGGGCMLPSDGAVGDPSPVALGTTVTEGATERVTNAGGINGLGTGVSPVSASATESDT